MDNTLLEVRYRHLHLQSVKIAQDGNCLANALIGQLGLDYDQMNLRRVIAAYMRENGSDYLDLIDSTRYTDYSAYLFSIV